MDDPKPTFNFRSTPQWRTVDAATTMLIAHRCSKGVNFAKCSKGHVIECMAKPRGYTANPEKFVGMMNEAAKFLPRMKAAFHADLNERLKSLELQLEGQES